MNADPDFLVPSDRPSIITQMEHIQRLLKHFWKRWRDEYLVGLRDMHRFNITTGGRGRHIALGDIVLVHDEAYPRTHWKLGRVERLIKGHDEQIRAAVVRVASRSGTTTLRRPVQLLYPLEINHADHEEAESEPQGRGAEHQDMLRRLPRRGAVDVAKLRIKAQSQCLNESNSEIGKLPLANWGRVRTKLIAFLIM